MIWGETTCLEIGGCKLECASFGPPPSDAPTLVLLHEGLGCVALWRDIPEKLARQTGYGVFVYSRAGYGGSDPVPLPRPLDYMTREAEETLPQVLDAAGIQKAVLLGHSDGATIAAIYAGSVIDMRVRGLILIAPHFFAEDVGLDAIKKAKTDYESGELKSRLTRYHAHVDVAFRGWCEAWLDPAFLDWNVSEVIDYFRIPVLAIQGSDDAYGTPVQINELKSRSYAPVDTVWLSQCGHAPHIEKPEQTLSAIMVFCDRLARIEEAQPEYAI